jgi:ethanolamine utilization protein EutP (predicted NTPase)
LAEKEEILVLSKADLFDDEMIDYIKSELKKSLKVKKEIFVISAPSFK